jgi:hypothetical protein
MNPLLVAALVGVGAYAARGSKPVKKAIELAERLDEVTGVSNLVTRAKEAACSVCKGS